MDSIYGIGDKGMLDFIAGFIAATKKHEKKKGKDNGERA